MFAMDKGITLTEWLKSCQNSVTDIKPCKITIGRTIYNACQYIQGNHTGFYVIGSLPASYRHSTHIKYMLDNKVFYIAGYYQESNPKFDQFHYDHNFLLFHWNLPEEIDRYERNPYRQMKMIVEYL